MLCKYCILHWIIKILFHVNPFKNKTLYHFDRWLFLCTNSYYGVEEKNVFYCFDFGVFSID